MNLKLKALLANRITLYVVLAISIASLFGYIMTQRTNALMFFVLTGYLTSFFTKNMAIVMLVPLLLTNFVFSVYRVREGLEGQAGKKAAEGEGATAGTGAAGTEAAGTGAAAGTGGKKEEEEEEEEEKPAGEGKDAPAEGGAKKPTSGNFKPNAELDVKKTKDMKYSYFEKALNGDSIDKLNTDMDNMSDKHEKLEKMIENMAPLVEKAGGLLDKMNSGGMSNLGGMIEKMSGMLGGISQK